MTDSVGPSLAVRAAEVDEVPRILELVAHSRSIMRANGNDVQWDGYPGADLIGSDISKGIGHVVTLDGVAVGYFALLLGFGLMTVYSLIHCGTDIRDLIRGKEKEVTE